MAAQPANQTMTVDEWRALEQASEAVKHEYIDGHLVAMAGGATAHGRIALNMIRELEDALAASGRSSYVHNSDVAVEVSATRYTYPDASVSCDERDRPAGDRLAVQSPRVIVVVLSDSTEAHDRGRKFGYYRACPHVQTYVLVATEAQTVEVYRRAAQVWTYQSYGPADAVAIESLGVTIAVAALYRLTDVPVPEGGSAEA